VLTPSDSRFGIPIVPSFLPGKRQEKLTGAEWVKSARQTQADAQHIREKAASARQKSNKFEDVNQAAFRVMWDPTESE
jgi:hypothetical protein